MEIILTFVIIIVLVLFFIAGNLLIYKWIVRRATEKYMRPYFFKLGFKITKTRFVGLFKSGDFKRKGLQFRPFMPSGYPMQSTYIYVYLYKNTAGGDQRIRITAKILTLFLFIKKIEYSQSDL